MTVTTIAQSHSPDEQNLGSFWYLQKRIRVCSFKSDILPYIPVLLFRCNSEIARARRKNSESHYIQFRGLLRSIIRLFIDGYLTEGIKETLIIDLFGKHHVLELKKQSQRWNKTWDQWGVRIAEDDSDDSSGSSSGWREEGHSDSAGSSEGWNPSLTPTEKSFFQEENAWLHFKDKVTENLLVSLNQSFSYEILNQKEGGNYDRTVDIFAYHYLVERTLLFLGEEESHRGPHPDIDSELE